MTKIKGNNCPKCCMAFMNILLDLKVPETFLNPEKDRKISKGPDKILKNNKKKNIRK